MESCSKRDVTEAEQPEGEIAHLGPISPSSSQVHCDVAIEDPFRKEKIAENKPYRNNVGGGLKRRLEVVENELKDSINEIKHLKLKLDTAEKERKYLIDTVNSMYAQIQYWNSWLGRFSTQMNEGDKVNLVDINEMKNSKRKIDAKDDSKEKPNDLINEEHNIDNVDGTNEAIKLIGNSDNDDKDKTADSVADMLKETAEHALASSGMAYDASSGLYYDWNTHMYYDPTTHLYYDNDNGVYYYYDNAKGNYVFYSQVNVSSPNDVNVSSPSSNHDKSEGELSSTESESEPDNPPCIRAIVTKSGTIKPGSLYLVTCNGATIGRDKHHVFHVPDKDASKIHAEIEYKIQDACYFIKDKGSINGTFLNEKRLSEAKKESDWVPIKHKDFLKIADSTFSLHLHSKQETCDGCEPGQVQALLVESRPIDYNLMGLSKEQARKKQLKGLKKKYSIGGDGLKQALKPMESGKYSDRASDRRKKVGSDPFMNIVPLNETKASTKKMISAENKGHQMMQKMGWKVGQGLGKKGGGIIEPVKVVIREKNKGLGTGVSKSIDDPTGQSTKFSWKKAKERYDDIVRDEKNANGRSTNANSENFDF